MGKNAKKIGNNPISRNLDRLIRSGDGTQKNLEKIEAEAGMARTTVRSWINGHRKPQQNSLEKIAKVFDINVYSFYDEPGEELVDARPLSPDQKEIIGLVEKIRDPFSLELLKTAAKIEILRKSNPPDDKNVI